MMTSLNERGKLSTAITATGLLLMQTEDAHGQMCGEYAEALDRNRTQFRAGRINARALGYVYGFVAAVATKAGASWSDVSVAIPILHYVLKEVFPGAEAACLQFISEHPSDSALDEGMHVGEKEYTALWKKNRPATGFAKILSDNRR
jgi:hypothetical protein